MIIISYPIVGAYAVHFLQKTGASSNVLVFDDLYRRGLPLYSMMQPALRNPFGRFAAVAGFGTLPGDLDFYEACLSPSKVGYR